MLGLRPFPYKLLAFVLASFLATLGGIVLGGALYTYLDRRLGDVGGSHAIQQLPGVLRVPLAQPLFLLGVLFVLIVFFLPGGVAGLATRGRAGGRALRRLEAALRPARGGV